MGLCCFEPKLMKQRARSPDRTSYLGDATAVFQKCVVLQKCDETGASDQNFEHWPCLEDAVLPPPVIDTSAAQLSVDLT